MYIGITELFKYQHTYCSFVALLQECKWYEFTKKKIIKEQIDFWHLLMINEARAMNNDTTSD